MTREEAIEVIKDIYNYTKWDTYTTNEARTMAIKAPEQEPCDNAINRQAVLDYIDRIYNQGTGKQKSFEFIQKFVEKLPPVTPQPKTGHWITVDYQHGLYECSECHTRGYVDTEMYKPTWVACPRCGARMESEL